MQNLQNKVSQALRWSEKYTQADMVYIAKGGFWITFGQIITNILSLVLVVAFANLLPKETYGTYRYILSLIGVLYVLTLTGMDRAVIRAVATGNEGILRASVKYQVKWNLLMLVAFWLLGGYYFLNNNFVLGSSLIILGVFVPLTAAFSTYNAYLDGKREFRLNNFFSIISTAIYVVGMILAIIFSGEVVWLVFAYAFATFISSLIFFIATIKIFNPPASLAPEAEKEALGYGRELTFIGFISPIASQVDKIVLSHFWGATQLAIYALALAIPEKATGLIKGLVGLSFPKIALKTAEEINTVFYKRILQGMAVGLVATLGYVTVVPYLFQYLLPQYLDSILYSQIISISFVFAMPNRFVSIVLESQKLSRLLFIRSVTQSIINIVLYVVLGIWGGILGLVIAYVLNTFIGMLINIVMWRYHHKF